MDISRRFGGIERLYGQAGLLRFQQSHICVIGVGGVGSWAVEALARSAIGELTLIDLDHVSESNINRQLPAVEENLGKAKVIALRQRVLSINPQCRVNTVEEFLDQENLSSLIGTQFDYVIDCIDSYRVKAALVHYCRRNKISLITVGGAGGQIDPTRIRVTDLSQTEQDPLLAKTRRLLRREYAFPANPKRRFSIASVWSDEPKYWPERAPDVCVSDAATPASGLNCGGYGSSMSVTATFGLVATAHVLHKLAARQPGD